MMNFQLIHAPEGETDYFFLAGVFSHDDLIYKFAATEQLIGDGECTGMYEVLLQNGDRTYKFVLKYIHGKWIREDKIFPLPPEVITAIGNTIKENHK